MFNISETKVDERATSLATVLSPEQTEGAFGPVYTFLIIADPHFGSDSSNEHADVFVKKYNALLADDTVSDAYKPKFIVNLGDIMDAGKQGQANMYRALLAKLHVDTDMTNPEGHQMMHYTVIGNHDLYASDGWETWKMNFYPHTSYYKFEVGAGDKKFSYYALDSGNGTLGKPQLEDLELRLAADPNPKIIFIHYPVVSNLTEYCLQNTLERNRLLSDFAKSNVKIIFSGHFHPGSSQSYGDFKEKTVKSFGYNDTALLVIVNNETQTVTYEEITF